MGASNTSLSTDLEKIFTFNTFAGETQQLTRARQKKSLDWSSILCFFKKIMGKCVTSLLQRQELKHA